MSQGFLVVESSVPILNRPGRCEYKGLYRTPEWSQPAFEAGFDDPLVFGNYTDTDGFIVTLADAHRVMDAFHQQDPRQTFEIIWTKNADVACRVPDDWRFLGIDVASTAPSWSIIADPPRAAFVDALDQQLNENGLFARDADAKRYLLNYRYARPTRGDVFLDLWDVYALPTGAKSFEGPG